ncbi:MAG: M23 family metallopeptidase [Marinisporobacter sp.]|jgi:murein DD-endopeptidase MepM/ murein hydrolase activator NlpD|nr:M23 family metallopeptidase [Marinisporobacter sp.]
MNFYKKLKQIANESLHIMIVPHSGNHVRQLNFKRMSLHMFGIFIITICISLMVLIYSNIHLAQQLNNQTNNLSKLQEINKTQALRINELKSITSEVSEKLSILDELEIQTRNLVGLKNKKSSLSQPVSRSSFRSKLPLPSIANPSANIEDTLGALSNQMDEETKNLNVLIGDVKKQLKFLAAKPNKMPARGRITSKFGYRRSPFTGRSDFHTGLDIANKIGTPVHAAGTGIVTFAGWNSAYGKMIIISHGYGYRSLYAHNSALLVKVGQKVQKGDTISKMGNTGRSTGPHVHFEVHYNGQQIDPQRVLNK